MFNHTDHDCSGVLQCARLQCLSFQLYPGTAVSVAHYRNFNYTNDPNKCSRGVEYVSQFNRIQLSAFIVFFVAFMSMLVFRATEGRYRDSRATYAPIESKSHDSDNYSYASATRASVPWTDRCIMFLHRHYILIYTLHVVVMASAMVAHIIDLRQFSPVLPLLMVMVVMPISECLSSPEMF